MFFNMNAMYDEHQHTGGSKGFLKQCIFGFSAFCSEILKGYTQCFSQIKKGFAIGKTVLKISKGDFTLNI